jgi:hypothetical protein
MFNRAPALLRRALCVFWASRPRSQRLPGKVGAPERSAASFERGGARPPPLAHCTSSSVAFFSPSACRFIPWAHVYMYYLGEFSGFWELGTGGVLLAQLRSTRK